jgi:hypothetical protein
MHNPQRWAVQLTLCHLYRNNPLCSALTLLAVFQTHIVRHAAMPMMQKMRLVLAPGSSIPIILFNRSLRYTLRCNKNKKWTETNIFVKTVTK